MNQPGRDYPGCGVRMVKWSVWVMLTAVAVCSASGRPAFGQASKSDGETKPKAKKEEPKVDLLGLFRMHYDNRVRSFKEQNQPYRNVVLLGDSITEGFEVPKFFPGRRVLNRGIGGDVIGNDLPENDKRGVLRRLDNSLYDCAATDVFVLIGVNDLNSGRNVDQMEKGYRELLKQIKERVPAVRVHVQTLLPTRDGFDRLNEPVREFNRRLKAMTAEFGNDFVDIHALLADSEGRLKAEYTQDGLHLNDAAYRVWRKRIHEILGWDDSAK